MNNKILMGVIFCVIIVGGIVLVMNSFYSGEKKISTPNNSSSMQDIVADDVVGKWNTVSAVSAETGEKVTNLRDIFGSSYSQYGSFLEFKEDGIFIDAIEPITNGSKVTTGNYEVKRDYNKPGDCYVFLTYSDGTEAKLQRVILDDSNTYYLVLEEFINGYQFTFKK